MSSSCTLGFLFIVAINNLSCGGVENTNVEQEEIENIDSFLPTKTGDAPNEIDQVQMNESMNESLESMPSEESASSEQEEVSSQENMDDLCSDGIDNDFDGYVDCEDHDCFNQGVSICR